MNIFFLAIDITENAQLYTLKHMIKIILEIAQMLYTAHHCAGTTEFQHKPYKMTHKNHPMSRWVRQHIQNYSYAVQLGLALCYTYSAKYNKTHACEKHLLWLQTHIPTVFDSSPIPHRLAYIHIPKGCTPVPLTLPSRFYDDDLLLAYRLYYIVEKQTLMKPEEKVYYIDHWNLRKRIPFASVVL